RFLVLAVHVGHRLVRVFAVRGLLTSEVLIAEKAGRDGRESSIDEQDPGKGGRRRGRFAGLSRMVAGRGKLSRGRRWCRPILWCRRERGGRCDIDIESKRVGRGWDWGGGRRHRRDRPRLTL